MPDIDGIDRSREGMRRRIEALNRKHCKTARELSETLTELVKLQDDVWRQGIVLAILEAFENLVRRTPVDTGRLRAGWRISDTGCNYCPPKGEYPQYQKTEIAAAVQDAIEGAGPLSKADVIWVYNNVEYALALNAGWSKWQAGGFIDLFMQEVKVKLEEMAALSRGSA